MQKTQQPTNRPVGDYEFHDQEILGKGYSSIVYKGIHTHTKQLVAIKAIKKESKHSSTHLNMISTEISALKSLRNQPHIINLLHVQQTSMHTYIITEFCEKGTLKRYMEKKKVFSEEEAYAIFTQIIKGYQAINQAGLIHRDIKPANIFLVKNNKVKIGDFGFSIRFQQVSNEQTLIIGSPMYMPYQALKKRIYTQKGDIWALGIILYQMLNGHSPFKAKTQRELIRQINCGSIDKLISNKFTDKTQILLNRMLEFDKDSRATLQEIKQIINQNKMVPNVQTKNLKKKRTRDQNNQEQQQKQQSASKMRGNQVVSNEPNQQQNHRVKSKSIRPKRQLPQKDIEQANQLNNKFKQISHELICQIHFCRFCYKLLTRMIKLRTFNISETLKNNMIGLIFKKLSQTQKLQYIPQVIVDQYRSSKYFQQIENVVSDYKLRYTQQIKKINQQWTSFLDFQKLLQTEILKIFQQIKDLTNPSSHCDLVIILDYMITLKQLSHLLQKQDLKQFQQNSKIFKIVQGVPSKNITTEHIKAIKTKLKGIKIL